MCFRVPQRFCQSARCRTRAEESNNGEGSIFLSCKFGSSHELDQCSDLKQTTGTSNIADKPQTREYYKTRILTDNDDLYTYLKKRDNLDPYSQRTTDLVAIDTGLEVDVKTYLIVSPTIYGMGSGLLNGSSIQLPTLVRAALKTGQFGVIGAGVGVWDAVHIEDSVLLYELLLSKVISGEDIPSGRKGIYFSETGDYTWMSLAQGIACEMYKQGALQTADVKQLTL